MAVWSWAMPMVGQAGGVGQWVVASQWTRLKARLVKWLGLAGCYLMLQDMWPVPWLMAWRDWLASSRRRTACWSVSS